MPIVSVAIYLGHIHVPVKLSLTLQVIELDQRNVTSVSYPWQLYRVGTERKLSLGCAYKYQLAVFGPSPSWQMGQDHLGELGGKT